ncbi:MAG: aldehyde ferredoxin oxidoreductase C-terminal domain-containing protein [Bacillota bacterium]
MKLGRLVKWTEDWYSLASCLGICARQAVIQNYNIDIMVELVRAATGMEVSGKEVRETGERAWNTLRLVNAREGFNREHDQVPRHFLKPLKSGDQDLYLTDYNGQQLTPEAVDKLFDGYYPNEAGT